MSAAAAVVEGADDVLDLGEGDAVIHESDDCEGCFLPDGTDWTAGVEEGEKEDPEHDQRCLELQMCGLEYCIEDGDLWSRRKMKRRWIRS